MNTIVSLYSLKENEIEKFLRSFFSNNEIKIEKNLEWSKKYENPVEIADIIGVFIDNNEVFEINMWISLDVNSFINVTNYNANDIIKYLFERYPY